MVSEAEEHMRSFEWYDIAPGEQFFDPLEKRFFVNFTKHPLKVGFSHNSRRVEMIGIGVGTTEDPDLKALEGEKVTEE